MVSIIFFLISIITEITVFATNLSATKPNENIFNYLSVFMDGRDYLF